MTSSRFHKKKKDLVPKFHFVNRVILKFSSDHLPICCHQRVLAQNEQQWRFKKAFPTSKTTSVFCSLLLFKNKSKSAFFFVCPSGKRRKEWTKKQKDQFNFFFAWFLFFILQTILFTKKNNLSVGSFVFWQMKKRKQKKTFSFVHEITSACLLKKKSKCWASFVLWLVLKER